MLISSTTIIEGDPVIDCTGSQLIVTDCCGAVVEDYTIVQELDDLGGDGFIACGTGPVYRGDCIGIGN